MKLLSTIAAVLISISAFSQDYVEYNEGTFSSNGKELSLDKVELIMKQYRVPFYRARLQSVKKQMRNCDKKLIRHVLLINKMMVLSATKTFYEYGPLPYLKYR